MWSTMAQFQTFFGGKPFLAYGIQLIPLTPIAELRDNYDWIKTLYPTFAQTCEADPSCIEQGWSILQYAVLATIGHKDEALKEALKIPAVAYDSAGGNGHSETNTIWYIATRPNNPPAPTEIPQSQRVPEGPPGAAAAAVAAPPPPPVKITCGCEKTCTPDVLATMADGYTCGSRIHWLMTAKRETEHNACLQISHKEHPDECGKCDPSACGATNEETSREVKRISTPPPPPPPPAGITCGCEKSCTPEVLATMADGYSCESRIKWLINVKRETEYNACLQISHKEHPDKCGKCDPSACGATKLKEESSKEVKHINKICPPCKSSVCKKAGCPVNIAPYLCTLGGSIGGCNSAPWDHTTDCTECCELTTECSED